MCNCNSISVWKCNWIPWSEGLRKPISNIVNSNLCASELRNFDTKSDERKIRRFFNNNQDIANILRIYFPRIPPRTREYGPLLRMVKCPPSLLIES